MIQNIFSLNPQILIEENSTFIEQSSNKYEVMTFGKITILNPSLVNQIYQMSVPLNNTNKLTIKLINSSNISLNENQIFSNKFSLNTNLSFEYEIYGVLTQFEYKFIKDNLSSIFEFETIYADLKPLRDAKLNKLERENQLTTNFSRRNIIVEITNPTEFEVNLKYLRLFKTVSNASAIINDSITLSEIKGIYLDPNQKYILNEIDFISDDKLIYWIEYEVITINNIVRDLESVTISRPGSNRGNDDEDEDIDSEDSVLIEEIVFKKTASRTSMGLNDSIIINLEFRNPNEDMKNVLLTDFLPEQFISISDLVLDIGDVDKDESILFEYFANLTLPFDSDIIYLEPAILEYDSSIYLFSNSLNIFYNDEGEIRKIIVEKELLPQENSTKVIIRIKNIGNVDILDIIVIETNDDTVFIDSGFEDVKYRWDILNLSVDEEWQVSYEIPKDIFDSSLPEVYIPEDTIIYKTLVLNEIVESNYDAPISPMITIVIATAVLLLLVDVIF